MFPANRHGSYAFWRKPIRYRTDLILLYQCLGLLQRPYKVRLRSQYSSVLASGLPMGGLAIVILSGGRIPCQNTFLQSPCCKTFRCSIAMLTMRRRVLGWSTGAYLSDLNHRRSSWKPRTTIRDFARWGLSISSGLIVRTHIVGIMRRAPFSQSALYWARLILLYVSINSMPDFSSRKLWSHTSRSGCRSDRAVRRKRGHSRTKLAVLTKWANNSWMN